MEYEIRRLLMLFFILNMGLEKLIIRRMGLSLLPVAYYLILRLLSSPSRGRENWEFVRYNTIYILLVSTRLKAWTAIFYFLIVSQLKL